MFLLAGFEVGNAVVALRSLAMEYPSGFEVLCIFEGSSDSLRNQFVTEKYHVIE